MSDYKKIQKTLMATVLVAVMVVSGLFTALMVPPKTADAGSLQLQAILDEMNAKCKNMNKGGDTWKACEKLQGKLVASAGCSGKMFRESSGKWSVNPTNEKNCQERLGDSAGLAKRHQDMVEFIKSKCNDVTDVRGGANFLVDVGLGATPFGAINTGANVAGVDLVNFDGNWNNCEGTQEVLKSIGCGNLFETTASSVIRKKWNWKQDAITACEKVINDIKTGQATKAGEGAAASSESGDIEVDNCKVRIKDLGWIVCPLIKIGIEGTDLVFQEFIEPMLVNVPISITDGNGTYEAWKQFRILGNILLIGTMLAVVYAQARSDQ